MEDGKVVITKIDTLGELENLVNKKNLILCDEMQNTFLLLEFYNKKKMGIAYYDYGIPADIKILDISEKMYIGLGISFLNINICKNEVIFNHTLQSVFFELLFAKNNTIIYVVCELDVYCYSMQGRKWLHGFWNIINDFKIIDDSNIYIKCEDNRRYVLSVENGEILG